VLVARLVGALPRAVDAENALLYNVDMDAVLGIRARLVHRRGTRLQWAPDDDACGVGEVAVEPAERWSLRSEVFAAGRREDSHAEDGHEAAARSMSDAHESGGRGPVPDRRAA